MKLSKPRITPRTNRTGSTSYCVDLGKVNGRRNRRFFQTKVEAEDFAIEAVKEHQRYGEQALQNTPEQRIEATKAFALLAAFPKAPRLTEVVEDYIHRHFPAGGEKTCLQVAEELVAAKQTKGMKPRYLRALRSAFHRFNQTFGSRPVHVVTSSEVEQWLGSQGFAPITQRNYQRDLTILFRYCVKRNYCTENPIAPIEKPRVVETEVKILDPEEAWQLLIVAGQRRTGKTKSGKTISTDLVPYLAIGLFAGLRSSEIEGLDWSDINLQARQIQVRSGVAKTSMRRSVEISDNLYAWLKPYEQERGGFVFTGWRDRLQKLQKAAGFKKWPENALRHSFASYHFAKHQSIDHTIFQTGHEDKRTFHRHYKQLIEPNEAARYWNIFPQKGWMKAPLPVKITEKQRKQLLAVADEHRATPFNGFTVLCTEDEDAAPDATHAA